MTPQQQYIITKEDYDQIYCIEYPLTSEERRRICERSRPAPSQLQSRLIPKRYESERANGTDDDPTICKQCLPENYMRDGCWCYDKHDATIRKNEREKMLPYLDELVSPSVSDSRKREILESLRSPKNASEFEEARAKPGSTSTKEANR